MMLDPVEDQSWKDQAACKGLTSLFFPTPGEMGKVREARAICAGCPVRVECAGYAIAGGEDFGIFGGLTPRERRRLRQPTRTCRWCTKAFHATGVAWFCSEDCRRAARAEVNRRHMARRRVS